MLLQKNIFTKKVIFIVLLLIIILIGIYFLKYFEKNISNVSNSNLSITVYEDKRCTNCYSYEFIEKMKLLPSISWANIIKKDFSEQWVSDYLKNNEIKTLPLIVFSNNDFDVSKDPLQWSIDYLSTNNLNQIDDGKQTDLKITDFLKPLPNWEFYLEIESTFNPFQEKSEKWFLQLDKEKLQFIKDTSYIKGNKNSKITFIQYSNLECQFCSKLYNDGIVDNLIKKYGNNLNIIFNHFILPFNEDAQMGAEILECVGEEKWTEAFYSLIKKSFFDQTFTKNYLIEQAGTLWINKAIIDKCLDNSKYKEKIKEQIDKWINIFRITWAPSNVLINNDTLEYEIIFGSYPISEFEIIIDKLLN